jgi:hypothetical protein
MLLSEHKALIEELIKKTDSAILTWTKGKSRLSYLANFENNRFWVDKYFAQVKGSELAACLNLSIFEKDNLLSEIVICKAFEDRKADYNLLNGLYTKVEALVSGPGNNSEISALASITQSLQRAGLRMEL